MSTRWVINCDTGIDDALALGVAIAHPDLEVAAVVASAGNAPLVDVVANTAAVLGLLGYTGPFGAADERALDGSAKGFARHVHGGDGMHGGRSRVAPGPSATPDGLALVTGLVLATGPLTTPAKALAHGQAIERIVWMGGGLGGGNVTPHAEFNAWWDPAAVEQVLTSGTPVRVVPLDVTASVRIRAVDVEALRAAAPVPAFFGELEANSHEHAPQAALHDPVAVLAAVEPERFDWRPMRLHCDIEGETGGRLTGVEVDAGETTVEVAVDADREALRDRVVELLLSLA